VTTSETFAPPRTRPLITVTQAALLVAAPLASVASTLLRTPQYGDPENTSSVDSARYLDELAAAPVRNGLGFVLMLVSAILFVGATVALTGIAVRRMRRVGLAGGVLTAIGAVGLAATSAQVGAAGVMADEPDREAMTALWTTMYDAWSSAIFFLALMLGSIGAILLAVALYRFAGIPRSAAVLTGIGTAALWPTTTGPWPWLIAGCAVVSLAGLAWVAVAARQVRSG
jgi:hypothetical protein